MYDVEITLDETLPADMVFVSMSATSETTARVTVSPATRNVHLLRLLGPALGLAVADAIDGRLPSRP